MYMCMCVCVCVYMCMCMCVCVYVCVGGLAWENCLAAAQPDQLGPQSEPKAQGEVKEVYRKLTGP